MPLTWRTVQRALLEKNGGAAVRPFRLLLRPAAALFARAVAARNRFYDRPGRVQWVAAPVISVGNVTVGGTGKTPLIIWLAQRLNERGFRCAVVARGYGASPGGLNDEMRLIQQACPEAACVCDPDRVRGARSAIEGHGANVILLDDAFQHRRIGRNLDIVTIDATDPFGGGELLPLGRLREPLAGLKRADILIITRADQAERRRLAQIRVALRFWNRRAPLFKCRFHVTSLCRLDGTSDGASSARRRVGLFAGVGNPTAFEDAARRFGLEVVARCWWPDHHRYRARDLEKLLGGDEKKKENLLWVTTSKDAVKLRDLPLDLSAVRVLEIEARFSPESKARLLSRIFDAIGRENRDDAEA